MHAKHRYERLDRNLECLGFLHGQVRVAKYLVVGALSEEAPELQKDEKSEEDLRYDRSASSENRPESGSSFVLKGHLRAKLVLAL